MKKVFVPNIALYRCGCELKWFVNVGKSSDGAYKFTFHLERHQMKRDDAKATLDKTCYTHHTPIVVLHDKGYFKTLVPGRTIWLEKETMTIKPLLAEFLDAEFSIKYE